MEITEGDKSEEQKRIMAVMWKLRAWARSMLFCPVVLHPCNFMVLWNGHIAQNAWWSTHAYFDGIEILGI